MQTARRGQPRSFWAVVRSLASEGPGSFYHGLVPGLLLTCNPAINYAAFDAMRALVASLRRAYPCLYPPVNPCKDRSQSICYCM